MFRPTALFTLALLFSSSPQVVHDGPTYTADGQLAFPADYREWVFLGAGLDMSYNKEATQQPGHSVFNTVFVNPFAYAAFKETGHWPQGTEIVLENSGAISDASINQRGKTMSGELMGVEVHVLDTKHNKTGWGFYSFGNPVSAKLISTEADCYSCHQQHAAVDTTFVQFYPALLRIARDKHTLAPQYLKSEALDPR